MILFRRPLLPGRRVVQWALIFWGIPWLLSACAEANRTTSASAAARVIFETVTPAPTPTQRIIKIPAPAEANSPTPSANTGAPEPVTLPQQLVEALNRERAAAGLTLYQIEPGLTKLAQAHAVDMADRDYFDHVTPEGKTFSQRLTDANFSPVYRGENIFLSVEPAEAAVADAVSWWLADAPHRENLLHPELTHVGVGVAKTPEGWFIFVVDLVQQ